MNNLIGIIVAGFLAAILSGVLGYALAVLKRDTAFALLQRDHQLLTATVNEQTERIDRHLKILFRLILDIARKSGVDVRTGDAVEIASLTDGEINLLDKDRERR